MKTLTLELTKEELYIMQFALASFKGNGNDGEIAFNVLKKTLIAEIKGDKKNDRGRTSNLNDNSKANNQASASAQRFKRTRTNKH